MRAVAVLREDRAGPEGLVTGHATKRAGRLLTLHRALHDAVLVNVKRAGRRAPEDLVQAVAGGQSGIGRADLSEFRGGHAEFEEPLGAPRLAGGLAGTFGWLCRLAVGLAKFSRALGAGLRAGLRVWGRRRGRAGRGVAPAGRHLGGRGRVALCGRRAPHLVKRGVSAGLRVLAGHGLDLRRWLLRGHLGLGRRAYLRAGRVNAGACGGFGWRAGCRREGPRTSAEGRQLLAWLRQKGRRACRRGGLRAGGAGRGGHAGDVHEAIRECMQKVADLLGAQLADLLAERAGGLAEQELPGARSHDAQGERLKRQC